LIGIPPRAFLLLRDRLLDSDPAGVGERHAAVAAKTLLEREARGALRAGEWLGRRNQVDLQR